jgi:steroid 5-alpha reductase family enzyme
MLLAVYITLGYFTLFFIIATNLKNNSIVDIGAGVGFVLVSWILFFVNGTYSVTQIIINVLISLWGLRLFYHILKRNLFEKEDFRYANWRKDWGKWVIPRAFLQVFMLFFRLSPLRNTSPESGSRIVLRIFIVVLFPAPLGPSIPNISPLGISKLIPFKALTFS